MGYRAITQLVLIVVSVVIITTYIRPTFESMQVTQDETTEYRTALENAAKFNEELGRLAQTANSFSVSERRALDRFLPEKVDEVRVMRDLETIVENNNMVLGSLSFEGDGMSNITEVSNEETSQNKSPINVGVARFELSVSGTYEQLKHLLQDIERNVYLLEVVTVDFIPAEGDLYTYSIRLETYSLSTDDEE